LTLQNTSNHQGQSCELKDLSSKYDDALREMSALRTQVNFFQRKCNKYETLFNVSADALSIIDLKSGTFIECNDSAVRMHGVESKSNFLNLRPDQISPEHQPCGGKSQVLAADYIGKTFSEGPQLFEWIHSRLDGSVFPCLVSLTALPVDGEQLVLAIGRDISDITEAKTNLEKHIQLLEEKREKQSHMFAVIGHELRTPISAIKMMAEDMKLETHELGRKRVWTLEKCQRISQKYLTRSDVEKNEPGPYKQIINEAWAERCFEHMM